MCNRDASRVCLYDQYCLHAAADTGYLQLLLECKAYPVYAPDQRAATRVIRSCFSCAHILLTLAGFHDSQPATCCSTLFAKMTGANRWSLLQSLARYANHDHFNFNSAGTSIFHNKAHNCQLLFLLHTSWFTCCFACGDTK